MELTKWTKDVEAYASQPSSKYEGKEWAGFKIGWKVEVVGDIQMKIKLPKLYFLSSGF